MSNWYRLLKNHCPKCANLKHLMVVGNLVACGVCGFTIRAKRMEQICANLKERKPAIGEYDEAIRDNKENDEIF